MLLSISIRLSFFILSSGVSFRVFLKSGPRKGDERLNALKTLTLSKEYLLYLKDMDFRILIESPPVYRPAIGRG